MASSNDEHDKRNFQWITVASVDLIKLPLIDILASYIKPVDLFLKIKSCSTLKLRPDQQKICLIQPPSIPDYNKFDVTLLYTLIRNLLVCCLPDPAQGWGKEPKTTDTGISDDIERLRLFRNNYYAHADSASVPDIEFEDVWRNLKLAIKRIACNSNIICNIDYEKEFREIERSKCTEYQLETCRVLLEAFVSLQKQTDSKDEPDFSIIGENEKRCGETAQFEANVEKVKSSSWSITWQKRRGEVRKDIDTSTEKYSGSTKRKLVIKCVCKEDEGEYQAVLSFGSNGPDYRSKNTIRLSVLEDFLSVKIFVNSPVCFGSKTTIRSEVSSTTTPEKIEWQKSKDEIDFHCIKELILFKTTARFECPSYVIPQTTFTDKLYYRLLVWNENGKGVSNTVYLDVTGNPPNIMTSFKTNIQDGSVKLIGNLYVYDDSPGILETFWTKNEKKINPEKSVGKLSEISNENPSLTIRNVSPDDAGEYRLTATNAVGSSTSEVIVLGNPVIFLEKIEDKKNGRHSITVMIKSLPAPYHVQWSAKNKDDEHYTPIDINTKEYEGTTVSFPYSVLVVKQRDQLEKKCFKIEVTNFIGKTVHEISGENNPVVLRTTDNVKETLYNDHGASVRFTRLNNILADEFPLKQVEKLKFLLNTSNKVKNRRSVLEATSAMDCLTILQDEQLFTQTDVIFMQFLCRETECLKLNDKCIEYAEKQKALCFFEKQSVNGCVDVQFHVQGDISGYTKEFIREVIETVAAILNCKEEDIHLNAVRYSTSFFLSLSIKKVYIRKLLALKEQDRLKLKNLNIDYLKIDEETIYLNIGEDNKMECGIRENSNADVDDIETEQALRDENNRKSKVEEIDSEEEHKNLLVKNDDDELFSEFELMDLMPFLSDYEDEPVDDQERESTEEEKKAEFITVISSDSDSGHRRKNVKQRPTTGNDTVEPEKKKKREIKDKSASTVYKRLQKMEFQRLSSRCPSHLISHCFSILDAKKNIARQSGISQYSVSIVDMEDGIIYEDERSLSGLKLPLQVMFGNGNRQFPSYLNTEEADMLTLDYSEDEPRLKMSCGHALSADNLFGFMKSELMTKTVDAIRCPAEGCCSEWRMQEIIRKADMTEDEQIFFEYRISLNAINKEDNSTSSCPSCNTFCQRQTESNVFCSKSAGKEFNFCWDCKSLWYPNHRCSNAELEAFQRILNEAPLKTLDYSHIEGVPSKRMCPNCHSLIEHESMCKEMTCIKCKFKFCFSCLKPCLNGSLQCSRYNMKCSVAPVQKVIQ